MSKTQAETVIKNIIREIVQECTTRGQIVSETLVAFTVIEIIFIFNFYVLSYVHKRLKPLYLTRTINFMLIDN